jgi:hypothetical protein
MTFLHWEIEKEYLQYLFGEGKWKSSSSLPFMKIDQSLAFNLNKPDDRKDAAEAIAAMVLFIEQRGEEEEEGEKRGEENEDGDEF